jgi:hypothetical protein
MLTDVQKIRGPKNQGSPRNSYWSRQLAPLAGEIWYARAGVAFFAEQIKYPDGGIGPEEAKQMAKCIVEALFDAGFQIVGPVNAGPEAKTPAGD